MESVELCLTRLQNHVELRFDVIPVLYKKIDRLKVLELGDEHFRPLLELRDLIDSERIQRYFDDEGATRKIQSLNKKKWPARKRSAKVKC